MGLAQPSSYWARWAWNHSRSFWSASATKKSPRASAKPLKALGAPGFGVAMRMTVPRSFRPGNRTPDAAFVSRHGEFHE
jgi:hypothetical protein